MSVGYCSLLRRDSADFENKFWRLVSYWRLIESIIYLNIYGIPITFLVCQYYNTNTIPSDLFFKKAAFIYIYIYIYKYIYQ